MKKIPTEIKIVFFGFLCIFTLFFVSRVFSLLSVPIFTDEAIYIRWAQIAKQDANWRFISLTDGKQPSFVWITALLLKYISDPLVAGRLVSVFAGFFSTVGLFFLTHILFQNKKIALLTSLLYVIYPMALVYDRMALYDSLVACGIIWTLYIEVLLIKKLQLHLGYLLGFFMGASVLTKSNGFFTIYFLPFSLLLFDWKKANSGKRIIKWIVIVSISIIIAYGIYSILRLSPYFHLITQKDGLFIYSFSDWITRPFDGLISNLKGLLDWLYKYMTVSFLLCIPLAFFVNRTHIKEKLFLFLWFLAPFSALALFGKLIYPRYIFFMTVLLLPLVAYGWYYTFNALKNNISRVAIFLVVVSIPLYVDAKILTDFSRSPIPRLDTDQYYNEWPSGVGVKEAVAFFQKESQKGKIFVATEGTFGLMPYSLEIYLDKNPNVKVLGFWPVEAPPLEMMEASKKMPTYVIFYQPCPSCVRSGEAPINWPLELISRIEKNDRKSSFSIYKVKQ